MVRTSARERLLAAALELFLDSGFDGASLELIAERAETTKSLLYYHFRSKADVLATLVGPYLEDFDALLASLEASASSGSSFRRAALLEYFDLLMRHRTTARLLTVDTGSREQGQLGDRLRLCLERLRAVLAPSDDSVRAASAIGAVARPVLIVTQFTEEQLMTRREDLVAGALAILE